MTKGRDKLPNQKVIVYGIDVGYQFSNTGNGSKTIHTGVYNVRPMTQEEFDEISAKARSSRSRRRKDDRTRKRAIPIFGVPKPSSFVDLVGANNDDYKSYVGEINYNLAGSDRRAKVWGTAFLKEREYPESWVTYESIYEDESAE